MTPSNRPDETTLTFDVEDMPVVGTLTRPAGPPAPAVLLLHGFTGSRDEKEITGTGEGVFSRTARLLAEAGYASLRIDFRGSGDSTGGMSWAETTYSTQIADACAAIDLLAAREDVDAARLAVLGWSQGGLVAMHAAAARPDMVKTAILWAPVINSLYSIAGLFGATTVARALADPPDTTITATLSWGGETTLNARFFQEMVTTSTPAAAALYPGPLKVIVGSLDTAVAPQPASGEVLMRYHRGIHDLSVFETDHAWGAEDGPQTIDGEMLPTTIAWLKSHL